MVEEFPSWWYNFQTHLFCSNIICGVQNKCFYLIQLYQGMMIIFMNYINKNMKRVFIKNPEYHFTQRNRRNPWFFTYIIGANWMGEEISCYCYVWIRRSWVAWTEDKLQANGMEITALQDFPSEEEYTEMVNLEHKVMNKE